MSGVLINVGVLQTDDPVSYLQLEPLPPYVHLSDITRVIDTPRPSLFYSTLPLLCTAMNANESRNRGGLGTRLNLAYIYIHSVVCSEGRVMGIVEVSRSIGDGRFKHCGVISTPDVFRCQLTENDL